MTRSRVAPKLVAATTRRLSKIRASNFIYGFGQRAPT